MFEPDYLFSAHPQPAERRQVADGVYWLHFPMPLALDHINLWLLDDGDAWVLVDAGLATAELRALWDNVIDNALDGKPIRRIILTHFHPDHVGLADWLARRFNAEVCMTRTEWATTRMVYQRSDAEADASFRDFLGAHGLQSAALDSAAGGGNAYRRMVFALPPEPHLIEAGSRLLIGGREWRVHIGRGHAPEHACLYRSDDHVLIAGDQILPRISSNLSVTPHEPDADPVCAFVQSLQALKQALPADTLVLPGHGLPFRGLRERVDDLVQHHRQQLNAAEQACRAEARTAFHLLPVLFERELQGPQIFFAMGEAIAHLNCLHAQGRVRRDLHDGMWLFQ